MRRDARARALARCDEEIEHLNNTHDKRAFLVAMGINDWEAEKRAIEREAAQGA